MKLIVVSSIMLRKLTLRQKNGFLIKKNVLNCNTNMIKEYLLQHISVMFL